METNIKSLLRSALLHFSIAAIVVLTRSNCNHENKTHSSKADELDYTTDQNNSASKQNQDAVAEVPKPVSEHMRSKPEERKQTVGDAAKKQKKQLRLSQLPKLLLTANHLILGKLLNMLRVHVKMLMTQ